MQQFNHIRGLGGGGNLEAGGEYCSFGNSLSGKKCHLSIFHIPQTDCREAQAFIWAGRQIRLLRMKQNKEGAQKVMMECGRFRNIALFIINAWKRECAALRLCKRGALHNRDSSSLFYFPSFN